MARAEDIPEPVRTAVTSVACPRFEAQPFVSGPPLAQRRIAIISTAALIRRMDAPFPFGTVEFRTMLADTPASDILVSHVSINFDRSGYQRDLNTIYPIDRMRELADEGVIGGVAQTHYTVLGSSDPSEMAESVDQIVGQLRQERIDSVLLTPV